VSSGPIEMHLTVTHAPDAVDALRSWLAAHEMKLTTIELAHGASPRQPMITAWRSGTVADALRAAEAIGVELAPLGVAITRVKLERAHDDDAAAARYLEHHVKVRVATSDLGGLAALAQHALAHLSRNPHRCVDGVEERFLTQRFAADADQLATRALDRLIEALGAAAIPIVKIERERVLHDDNLGLDAGWSPEISS